MPDRIVRSGILTSERINRLSAGAEVFFRRLMSLVDDFGRHDGRVAILRAQLYPLQLDQVGEAQVGAFLQEAVEAGVVSRYEAEGKPYVVIPRFGQRLRAATSKWPAPPEESSPQAPRTIVSTPRTSADTVGHSQGYTEAESESESESSTESKTITVAKADALLPAAEEVVAFGQGPAGIPEDFCRYYHSVCEEQHRWIRNGQLIAWRKELVRWWSRDRPTWGGGPQRARTPEARPLSTYDLSKRLEAIDAQVKELRARGWEDAMGWHAASEADRAELRRLKARKAELQTQLTR